MSRRDPAAALLRALTASGPPFALRDATSRDWASAMFVGARHRLDLDLDDDAAATQWLGTLSEAEFTLSGHVLVDLVIDAIERRDGRLFASLTALTLIDD